MNLTAKLHALADWADYNNVTEANSATLYDTFRGDTVYPYEIHISPDDFDQLVEGEPWICPDSSDGLELRRGVCQGVAICTVRRCPTTVPGAHRPDPQFTDPIDVSDDEWPF